MTRNGESGAGEKIDLYAKNPWAAPSWTGLFGIQLEGPMPSDQKRAKMRDELDQARREWQPGPEAWALLERVRALIGREVVLRFWSSFIPVTGDEPHPLRGRLIAAEARQDSEGLMQAYLKLADYQRLPEEGAFAEPELLVHEDADGACWVSLGTLYEIEVLGRACEEGVG